MAWRAARGWRHFAHLRDRAAGAGGAGRWRRRLPGAVRAPALAGRGSRWATLLRRPAQDEVLHRGGDSRGQPLIGQSPQEIDLFRRDGVRVIDVLRGDASLRRDLAAGAVAGGRPGGLAHRDDRAAGPAAAQGRAHGRQAVVREDRDGRGADRPRLPDGWASRWATCGCAGAMASTRSRCIAGTRTSAGSWTIWWCGWATRCCWKVRSRTSARLAADMDLVDVSRPSIKAFRRSQGTDRDCGAGRGGDRCRRLEWRRSCPWRCWRWRSSWSPIASTATRRSPSSTGACWR